MLARLAVLYDAMHEARHLLPCERHVVLNFFTKIFPCAPCFIMLQSLLPQVLKHGAKHGAKQKIYGSVFQNLC
jgi:hypothetical protein